MMNDWTPGPRGLIAYLAVEILIHFIMLVSFHPRVEKIIELPLLFEPIAFLSYLIWVIWTALAQIRI
jgi:hypothetical protein